MTLLSLGDCRRRRRFRGSTYSLDIVALPRPAAFLRAALGHGPDFADRVSLLAGSRGSRRDMYPACDFGLASGLAGLVRASALTLKQVLVIRAHSAWSGLQLQCAPRL